MSEVIFLMGVQKMRRLKISGKMRIVFVLVVVFSFLIVHIVQAVTADPGSDNDPIVTQSYVDAQVSELGVLVSELGMLVENLTAKVDQLTQQVEDIKNEKQTAAAKFEVLELTMGQQLIAGASAEIVLRGGKATAVAGEKGGLSDVTSGNVGDLVTGQDIPLNHLLIVSRDDGRGLIVTSSKAYILFKGTYEIK